MSIESQRVDNGRYRLLRLISHSSTSEVYLAEDTQVSHQVVIKVISPEPSVYANVDTTRGESRFLPEAGVIKKFNHPHILTLLGCGEEVVNGNMLTYLIMPFCPEGSLAAWLKQRNSLLSPQEVAQFVRQAAAALTYAHYNHIIHLNVKLSNFLIQSHKAHELRNEC